MPFSNNARQLAFEHLAGKVAWPFLPFWVGLSTTIPDEDGNGDTPPSTLNNYVRAATTPATWGVYVPKQLINALPIPFNVVQVSDWGTISVPILAATFWRSATDASPASFMGYKAFGSPRIMLVGEQPIVQPGQISLVDLFP